MDLEAQSDDKMDVKTFDAEKLIDDFLDKVRPDNVASDEMNEVIFEENDVKKTHKDSSADENLSVKIEKTDATSSNNTQDYDIQSMFCTLSDFIKRQNERIEDLQNQIEQLKIEHKTQMMPHVNTIRAQLLQYIDRRLCDFKKE